jgi:hypothetical protein
MSWQFWSHKVMRLFVPYALLALLLASMQLSGFLYQGAFAAQVVVYGLGILGLIGHVRGGWRRITSTPSTFLLLNIAAVTGVFRYLAGWRLDLWQPAMSGKPSGH